MTSLLASDGRRRTGAQHWEAVKWSVALFGLVAAWFGVLARQPLLAEYLGIRIRWGWFMDTEALLAAGEAHVRGMPVYTAIPLDVLQRPHSYSHWWLWLGDLGLQRADTLWLGGILVVVFVIVAVWTIRPRNERDVIWAALVLASPSIQLCLARANNDLMIFLALAPLVPCLLHRRAGVRLMAGLLVGIAAGLKYFPGAAALLLLRADDRRFRWWRAALTGVLLIAVGASVYPDIRHFASTLPSPAGLFAFGAPLLLRYFGLPGAATPWVGGLVVLGIAAWEWRRDRAPTSGTAPTAAGLYFVLGAVLLAACFWVAMNWSYRWVFAVWLLPVLLHGDQADLFAKRRWLRPTLLALLVWTLWWDALGALAWNAGPGAHVGLPLARFNELWMLLIQPAHWALALTFTTVCVRFAMQELRRPSPGATQA